MSSRAKPTPRPSRLVPPPRPAAAARGCPIVGVGASAGGLEAFTQLLKHLPVDTGFGFVLVQHLAPLHESALTQLLARVTTMPVREVTQNLRVEANQVYIIPPNRYLGIADGVLKLRTRSGQRPAPRVIDAFFEALARDQRERAIGVILSGNATDGTIGLEAIKAEGGFTFAQDGTARHDSMPRNAAAAGCVDLVLSPEKIAKELARIALHPYVLAGKAKRAASRVVAQIKGGGRAFRSLAAEAAPAGRRDQIDYQKILVLLRNHSRVDFSLYKAATIQRRITRRTVLNQCPTLASYADFLRNNPVELEALYADALISVTSFFRNADAFDAIQRRVFTPLLQEKSSDPIRVWVLGCSTGQEAYSLAMAFAETAAKAPRARKLQIFATDLNEANLVKARHGLYAKSLVQDISPQRLRRFFVQEEGGYRVIKALRESVVFARQNIISDPAFSRLDLISCRNLLIYFEPSLQKSVLPIFHYALKPGGFLFLGASESVGGFGDLFAATDKKQKIFVKKAAPLQPLHLPVKAGGGNGAAGAKNARPTATKTADSDGATKAFPTELTAEREADRLTLSQFAPPAVLVNTHLQVLQFRGPTGAYLEPPTGKASFDLLRMARDGLMLPLRAAITAAQRGNRAIRKTNIPFEHDGRTRLVNLEVVPLKNLKEPCYLILFEDAKRVRRSFAAESDGDSRDREATGRRAGTKSDDSRRVAGLERDLSDARDFLHSVQEHQEAANEELQASNEEGQSANEELQSLNEELETSKEELESTNEELTTVNEEMVSRNTELHRLMAARREAEIALRASDERFRALFELGPVGVYSCDNTGGIQEFNRTAVALWGRTPKTGDASEKYCGSVKLYRPDGRYLAHAHCPMAAVLKGKLPEARDLEVVIERPDRSRLTVMVNIVPLKNDRGETTGAINCFYDITARKRADAALVAAQAQLSRHSEGLEHLVAKRTAQLTATNRHLETSVASNQAGKEEYRLLLAESQVMQKKLRHVTHQIITAQEEERKEISRELHDEVVQTLIGINVELSALATAGAAGTPALKKRLTRTQRLVAESVTAVHRFARGLRPAVLDDLGLIPALHAYCRSVTEEKKIKIQMTAFAGVEALNNAGRTVLFRVAQEALTNVVRHARATRVEVSIEEVAGKVRMKISDNGQSFPVEKILNGKNPKRLGLVGMKERIEMVGGSWEIKSAPGFGTTVRADVPFTPEKAER